MMCGLQPDTSRQNRTTRNSWRIKIAALLIAGVVDQMPQNNQKM